MELKKNFCGILPAAVTPFDKNGDPDLAAYEEHIEFLFDSGVDGLYVCGATGDSLMLSVEERKAVISKAVELCKKYGKTSITHVGSSNNRDSIELAKHVASVGGDSVSAMPIANTTSDELVSFYEAIADASDLPLLVYFIPGLTHRDITMDEMFRILNVKNVYGMKFSSTDLFLMHRLLLKRPDITVFNGNDEILTYGLLNGAKGGIGMTYNVFPALYAKLWRFVEDGNVKGAMVLQRAVNQFIDYAFSAGCKATVEYGATLRTGHFDCFRRPFAVNRLNDAQKADIRELVAKIDKITEEA